MDLNTLTISEIFYTLQGEGPLLGLPAVFIRLGGCVTPYCPWCDTSFALNEHTKISHTMIIEKIKSFPCRQLVITGGEPFMQWDHGLSQLHIKLIELGYDIQYETSGKADIPNIHDAVIVLSPKYIAGKWLVDPLYLDHTDYIKFVFQEGEMAGLIKEFIQGHKIPMDKIFIMPLGKTRQEQLKLMKTCYEYCLANGFRMTPRLHTLIFSNKQGV